MGVAWNVSGHGIPVLGLIAALLTLAAVAKGQTAAPARKTTGPGKAVLYSAVGAELTEYDMDIEGAALVRRGTVTLPGYVQEAWEHPSRHYLYVAWSTGGASYGGGAAGNQHGVSVFRIDPASGALALHGQPAPLPARPIYITGDVPGTHLLAAYNDPSGLTVHPIAPDGTVGSPIKQPAPLDVGIYAHQVRVTPSNKVVILVTRGNRAAGGKPEDPGAVKVFQYNDGLLANQASIAPGGGYGYQSRHLDFHPTKPWVFLSLEPQDKLYVYKKLPDDTLDATPLFMKDTLADPGNIRPGQWASTVHMHPNGKFVYVGNRANNTTDFQGKPVFVGGENNIAVFAIDPGTGEPTLIQNADTQGIYPRTFAIDPSGRLLVVGNQSALAVRDGNSVRTVLPSLAVFRVGSDGKLEFARKYDFETDGKPLFWMGMVSLP
jgi:6-phosphogluconolactonase